MRSKISISYREILLALVLLAVVMVGNSSAVITSITFNLTAGETTVVMPDCARVPMWGFGITGSGIITVPGPLLEVPPSVTDLTINLTNTLPVPISLMIYGQKMPDNNSGPVWTAGVSDTVVSTGTRPAGNYTARVRSFTHETPPGNTRTYTWTGIKRGTFLYTSAANPAVQVHKGLYGGIKADAAANQAYADASTAYNKELILIFSEVDPVIAEAVSAGNYGPGKTITSMLNHEPKYFLINGKAYPNPALNPLNTVQINAGDSVLLRFLNAGLETHIPILHSNDMSTYMTLLAQDGILERYLTKRQYTIDLPTGKTVDAMFNASINGKLAIYDRRFRLANAGRFPGGMLAFVTVGPLGAPPAADTVGPTTSGFSLNPALTNGATTVTINATANDTATGSSNIYSAEWWAGADPGPGRGTPMNAVDGAFNSPTENLTRTIDVSTWALGDYTIYVRSQDAACNWGAPVSSVLSVNRALASPVHRFWSDVYAAHFFTISEAERAYIAATWPLIWTYEGVGWYAYPSPQPGTMPVHRFWSNVLQGHFFTISEAERTFIINTYPGIWTYEGVAFYAYVTQAAGTLPVHRFWSDALQAHFFTISEAERAYIAATWPLIWTYEGVAWYAYPNP